MNDPVLPVPGPKTEPTEAGVTPGMSTAARSFDNVDGETTTATGASSFSKIRWYESWIIRAAIISIVIIGLGYISGAYFAWQGIVTIGKLAHMEEVEEALGSYLETIRTSYQMQQNTFVLDFKPLLTESTKKGTQAISSKELLKLLKKTSFEPIGNNGDLTVSEMTELNPRETNHAHLKWLSRDQLQAGNFKIDFPKGKLYEEFKATEDLRQRYQLIGARLESQITPTLIQASVTIMLISFVLLVGLFWIYAQRFKDRIGEVLQGFSLWSEHDSKFRFSGDYSGELKMITSQFNAMANEVEANRQKSLYLEKIASWQIIARKLAHEIKNPLTPIQMMVSQLKRRYKGEDPEFSTLLEEAHQIISEEVTVLRRMVDNFSNFARLPEPELKPIDLNQVCRHVTELQKNAFPQHNISFETRHPTAPAVADNDLLRQVLLNLIKNAGEACGETPSVITTGLVSTSSDYIVTVKDNGPGIPADTLSRVFEAYFTTKHTGPNPGMGLGLAVCQKIILDHGGKLSVISRPGETVFSIRLPKDRKPISSHGPNV